MPVRFCAECNNMLYACEDKDWRRRTGEKRLIYACRNCPNRELAEDLSEPVYRHVVTHTISEKTVQIYDVASDPTLPRTYETMCKNCGCREIVYFQSPVGKNDDMLVLYFVCTSCKSKWLSSDE